MTTTFEQVLGDLEAEQAALERVLNATPPIAWDLPTHAPGWSVRDQVSHLAFFDEAATLAIRRPLAFMDEVKASRERGADQEGRYLEHGRSLSPHGVLDWWRNASGNLVAAARDLDPGARLPWYGPPMGGISFLSARLMETWSHGLDVVDVTHIERPDTDRLRHVAFIGVRTRPFSYTNRGLE
ncbi:MAG: maleylpyruvate isomerase N-terminal domain-containing protein, partial [Tepidiformaceae bacterium]